MLHTIIIKFPESILDDQSQTLFMHLVVCLANDQDTEVRSMTGAAIKYLIRYISASSVHHILESSISWYLDSQSQLWSAAAQVKFLELFHSVISIESLSFLRTSSFIL